MQIVFQMCGRSGGWIVLSSVVGQLYYQHRRGLIVNRRVIAIIFILGFRCYRILVIAFIFVIQFVLFVIIISLTGKSEPCTRTLTG
jgi:hypothetical protein